MTYSTKDILDNLRLRMKDLENRQYGRYTGNSMGAKKDYLLDTPHDFWTHSGELPEIHSTDFLEAVKKVVASARRSIDIVTMDEPRGKMYEAIIDGLIEVAKPDYPVAVRILIGSSLPNFNLYTDVMLRKIGDKLKPYKPRMTLYMGQYRWKNASWGHSKFIAVDGKHLIVGGHNLWSHHYLNRKPVFDLTMRFDGPIASGAHLFARELWTFVRREEGYRGTPGWTTYCHRWTLERGVTNDPPPGPKEFGVAAEEADWSTPAESAAEPAEAQDTMPALWVTDPGWGVLDTNVALGSGMIAFNHAVQGAKLVRMSLQDLGTPYVPREGMRDFDTIRYQGHPSFSIRLGDHLFLLPVIDALSDLIRRNIDNRLQIVLTSPRGSEYSHNVPLKHIFNLLGHRMHYYHGLSKPDIWAKLNGQVVLGTVGFKDQPDWPGGVPRHNHAKFWMCDDRLFYVGSENFYPAIRSWADVRLHGALQEFGVIAEATNPVRDMILDNYFKPMLKYCDEVKPKIEDLTW